ncbi:hypothetical protein A9Q89_10655 [Gammaproteobacteria bacterium 53_120_T64]|nr:hypothetical protein A9Q89_10655 [Gammaproteobacteria bacterium 53_120_T64]
MNDLPVLEKTQSAFVQLTRYAFFGVVSNSLGYLAYFLLTYLGATPKITMTVLYGVGAAIGYIGNRNVTFAHKGSLLGSGVRYFITHFIGYFINLVILIIFIDRLGYAHQWVQAIAVFVVAGFLFIAFKFFVFTNLDELKGNRL